MPPRVARDAVRDFRHALERLASGARGGQGPIAIAALPSITCAALPAAITRFRADHPETSIALHDVQHERALSLVTDGTRRYRGHDQAGEDTTILCSRRSRPTSRILSAARDHPLARKKTVRWKDLAGLDFIATTRISSVRRLTDAAFIHAETAIEPRYEVEQIPSAVALVEAGLGVTALPSLTFSMFKGRNLAVRPLIEPSLRRNVGFVTLKGRTLPGNTDKLMRLIRARLLAELKSQRSQ